METRPTANRLVQTGRAAPENVLYVPITSVDILYNIFCEAPQLQKALSFIFLTRCCRLIYRTRNLIEHGEQFQISVVFTK